MPTNGCNSSSSVTLVVVRAKNVCTNFLLLTHLCRETYLEHVLHKLHAKLLSSKGAAWQWHIPIKGGEGACETTRKLDHQPLLASQMGWHFGVEFCTSKNYIIVCLFVCWFVCRAPTHLPLCSHGNKMKGGRDERPTFSFFLLQMLFPPSLPIAITCYLHPCRVQNQEKIKIIIGFRVQGFT